MTEHTHEFGEWSFPSAVNTLTICTVKVAHEGYPVLWVSHDEDGGWQFLDAPTEDPDDCLLLCLGCILDRDATLSQVSDLPIGWSAARDHVGGPWERWGNPAEEDCEDDEHTCNSDVGEAKALADIDEYGLHIIAVQEEGELPPFAYSIGIEKSLGLPELIVIGLKRELAHSMINECYKRMKAGISMPVGAEVDELLGGDFKCLIGEVLPIHFAEYMGWAKWLYKGEGFRAQQIIFPSTAGVYPWEPEASEWFRNRQPLLGKSE